MTSNQLQYWRNVETERANKATEALRSGELGVKQQEANIRQQEANIKQAELELDQWVEEYKKWLAYDHNENEYRESIAKLVSAILGSKGVAAAVTSIVPMLGGIF